MFSLLSTAKFRCQKSRIRGLLLYGHLPMRTRIPQNLRIPFRGSEDFFLYVSHVCLTDSKNKGDSAVYRYTSDLTYETYTSSYTSNPQILKRRRYVAVPKILEMKPQNLRFRFQDSRNNLTCETYKKRNLNPRILKTRVSRIPQIGGTEPATFS